jgi:hypothetical protein
MALIYCPDCGTQISEHAQHCTTCSYPISKLKNNNSSFNNFNNNYQKNSTIRNSNDSLIVLGYIIAFLSLLFLPLLFIIVGIVVGIVTITKGHVGHGVAHILLSLVLGIIGFVMGALGFLINLL